MNIYESFNIERCVICFDLIEQTNKSITKCNHIFHTNCLIKWSNINNSCPMCKKKLFNPSYDVIQINLNNDENIRQRLQRQQNSSLQRIMSNSYEDTETERIMNEYDNKNLHLIVFSLISVSILSSILFVICLSLLRYIYFVQQ